MEQKSTFLPAMRFAVLNGVILIVFLLILFLLNVRDKSPIRFISSVIYIGLLYWGITNIRNHQLDGVMNYGKAFSVGFLISLFTALFVGVFMFFYYKYIDMGAMDRLKGIAEQNILTRTPDISDVELNKQLTFYQTFVANPLASAFWSFIGAVFSGTIFSLIIAIFAKREDRTLA